MGKLAVALFGLMFALGAGLVVHARRPAPAPPLRLGLNPWAGYEFLFLAREKGYFAEEGVDVRLVEFSSVEDARRAYEHNQLDGIASSMVNMLLTRAESRREPQAFLVADASNGVDMLVAGPGVRDLADLRGKRIGIERAAPGLLVLGRALDKAGLRLGDVDVRVMDLEKMPEAMRTGAVDAAVCYPPISTDLARAGGRVLFTSAAIPGEIVDAFFFDRRVLEARPREAAAIVRAWDKALEFAVRNPAEAYRSMARRMLVSEPEVREQLEGIQILRSRDQRRLFARGGKLDGVVGRLDEMARALGLVSGPNHTGDIVARQPVLWGTR